MVKFTAVCQQYHPVAALDDLPLDLRLKKGGVCQTAFQAHSGGGDENGIRTDLRQGFQC